MTLCVYVVMYTLIRLCVCIHIHNMSIQCKTPHQAKASHTGHPLGTGFKDLPQQWPVRGCGIDCWCCGGCFVQEFAAWVWGLRVECLVDQA